MIFKTPTVGSGGGSEKEIINELIEKFNKSQYNTLDRTTLEEIATKHGTSGATSLEFTAPKDGMYYIFMKKYGNNRVISTVAINGVSSNIRNVTIATDNTWYSQAQLFLCKGDAVKITTNSDSWSGGNVDLAAYL